MDGGVDGLLTEPGFQCVNRTARCLHCPHGAYVCVSVQVRLWVFVLAPDLFVL